MDLNVVTVLQVAALILLTIGVYPYRIRTKNRNLIMHGFLSIVAIILNLATMFYAMVPAFGAGVSHLIGVSVFGAAIVLVHAVLGAVAVVAGLIIIVPWVTHPLGEMGCNKMWKWMIPVFAIWATALVLGIIINVFAIL